MLTHLDEVKTVTGLPVDPQQESLVGPDEEESSLPAVQPGPKTGQSRGRRAKGRRLGATATPGKNKGEKTVYKWIYFRAVHGKHAQHLVERRMNTCKESKTSSMNTRICVSP